MKVHTEVMFPDFTKHWLEIGKFKICLHHFTGPDPGPAHDHPLGFWSRIVKGGYIEEIWNPDTSVWDVIERKEGDYFYVRDTQIHRILSLPEGECITMVEWDTRWPRRQWLFWRNKEFGDGLESSTNPYWN